MEEMKNAVSEGVRKTVLAGTVKFHRGHFGNL